MKVCGVSFKENGKLYHFFKNDVKLEVNDYAIVETEKGQQLGKVVFIEDREQQAKQLKNIIAKASKNDYEKYLKNLSDAKIAVDEAKKIVKEMNLNMQFIDCSYTFDRKQLLFNFLADERVDFRELVKLLASKFKTRIELHQVGVRDKSKEIGGLGPCGKTLCCSTFLTHIDTISINMAKNQNIALNPSKINGSCGRLLCCLSYEDDQYLECRKGLPNVGEIIKYENQNAKVISVDILNRKYKININDEIKEIIFNDKPCCK